MNHYSEPWTEYAACRSVGGDLWYPEVGEPTWIEEALEMNPPIIVWRKRRNGVFVKVSVYDPFADGGHNREKAACIRGHKYTEDNTIITRDGRQCRTCKNAMRKPLTPEQKRRALDLRKQNRRQQREETANTSLTTAARTQL